MTQNNIKVSLHATSRFACHKKVSLHATSRYAVYKLEEVPGTGTVPLHVVSRAPKAPFFFLFAKVFYEIVRDNVRRN
jgi:hypothetical protein